MKIKVPLYQRTQSAELRDRPHNGGGGGALQLQFRQERTYKELQKLNTMGKKAANQEMGKLTEKTIFKKEIQVANNYL